MGMSVMMRVIEFNQSVDMVDVRVVPQPYIMMSSQENLIFEAKDALGIQFDLDYFQVQALLGLINEQNVVVSTPCGSGKSLIFQMGVISAVQKYTFFGKINWAQDFPIEMGHKNMW